VGFYERPLPLNSLRILTLCRCAPSAPFVGVHSRKAKIKKKNSLGEKFWVRRVHLNPQFGRTGAQRFLFHGKTSPISNAGLPLSFTAPTRHGRRS